MRNCRILLFARARDLAGAPAVTIPLEDGGTVADLRRALAARFPALTGLVERSAFAINDEFADNDVSVPLEAEIALLPPVSGG